MFTTVPTQSKLARLKLSFSSSSPSSPLSVPTVRAAHSDIAISLNLPEGMQFNFLFSTIIDTLLRNLNLTGAVKGDPGNFCSHYSYL
jgi:hypothetical protein